MISKILSGIPTEFQTVWVQFRTDVVSVLIWVQTVWKDYQQTTKVAATKEKVNMSLGMRFPTMWYEGPAKPQISLRICAV